MRNHPVMVVAAIAALAASVPALAQAPEATRARDMAATCANCHGTGGISRGETESLAGKPRDELSRKMQEFKTGAKPGTIMPQLIKGFSDAQIELLAGWFAAQPSK
jgi:cytochrome subunit of sulfide dehydrogenase